MAKSTEKAVMGRPTLYEGEKTLKKVREYLAKCEDEEYEFHKTRGMTSDSYERHVRVKIPTIEGCALYLGVRRSTLYEWQEKHLDFSDIMGELLEKQADMLMANGLSGDYNPTIAKVLLTKHGYREGTELSGTNGSPLIPVEPAQKERAKKSVETYLNGRAKKNSG